MDETMAHQEAGAVVDYNTGYLRTNAGALRVGQGVIALTAIICSAEGAVCGYDSGKYGFFLFVVITSMLEAILILLVIVLRLEQRVPVINVPLSLILNDCTMLLMYFVSSLLMMLSIGTCRFKIEARIIASLLGVTGFLFLIGLIYTDYLWWRGEETPNSKNPNESNGTGVAEPPPRVLTLS